MPSWQRRRVKTILTEIDRRTTTGTEPLLSLRARAGLVDHLSAGGKPIDPSALVGYKIVRPGELVMNRMRAATGVFGLAEREGLVSPDYALFQLEPDVIPAYILELLRTPAMADQMRLRSRGMGTGESGFLRLYTDAFGAMPLMLPPVEEQQAIVRYLAYANNRINRAANSKRRLNRLLGEQRKTIINRIVLAGTDPGVELMNSGSRFVGSIPAHWDLMRFSQLVRPVQRAGFAHEALLSVYLGKGVIPYNEGGKRVHAPSVDLSAYQLVEPGDLVMNNQQAWRGSVGVSSIRGIVSPAYLVAKLSSQLDSTYARHLFASRPMVDQYVVASKGVGDIQRTLYWPYMRNVLVPVPPMSEQRKIVTRLEQAVTSTDHSVARVSREIALLEEFRTRLTSDVVTGRIDVREIAATLPPVDVVDVSPAVEEIDEADDDESAVEELVDA
ncbi:restriction endonuclease subunit S [Pseudonocardia alni]|uniref:Type I restriction enzyme S subunit n=1 Tax=Pseudonocardia alni TaxID=33907 RepID=A0A852VVW4_PSEA5|nr:hypothetical protein [Pseudonocardia antarctica]NYG00973.1 type I restriction enzyme S subunit [Pseudonocardia antarctica]